jgi:hypothetical protein
MVHEHDIQLDYYIDNDSTTTLQTVWLHKPYFDSLDGKLDFNFTNLSFRSGNYASYVDNISDEAVSAQGYEDASDATLRFSTISTIADEGYEITITDLEGAFNGVYVVESFTYKPISLDIFEYTISLKFIDPTKR